MLRIRFIYYSLPFRRVPLPVPSPTVQASLLQLQVSHVPWRTTLPQWNRCRWTTDYPDGEYQPGSTRSAMLARFVLWQVCEKWRIGSEKSRNRLRGFIMSESLLIGMIYGRERWKIYNELARMENMFWLFSSPTWLVMSSLNEWMALSACCTSVIRFLSFSVGTWNERDLVHG